MLLSQTLFNAPISSLPNTFKPRPLHRDGQELEVSKAKRTICKAAQDPGVHGAGVHGQV